MPGGRQREKLRPARYTPGDNERPNRARPLKRGGRHESPFAAGNVSFLTRYRDTALARNYSTLLPRTRIRPSQHARALRILASGLPAARISVFSRRPLIPRLDASPFLRSSFSTLESRRGVDRATAERSVRLVLPPGRTRVRCRRWTFR